MIFTTGDTNDEDSNMTVGLLKDHLEMLNPELPVIIPDGFGGFVRLEAVLLDSAAQWQELTDVGSEEIGVMSRFGPALVVCFDFYEDYEEDEDCEEPEEESE